jgi:DNA transformation protein
MIHVKRSRLPMASRGKPRRQNPLAVTPAFRQFVCDQLAELGDVTAQAMFGGVGLYHRGLFFGIIAGDVLYLKVDESNRGDYVRAGMGPFKPYPNRSGTMQYYAVPVEVLESSAELGKWARRAVTVAGRRVTS